MSLTQSASAHARVEFSDLSPLLEKHPELLNALEGVSFSQPGIAFRIGHKICPALAGERVGPYLFQAWQNILSPEGGRMVEVEFLTDVKFYDSSEKMIAEWQNGEWVVGEDIESAIRMEEELTAITVKPMLARPW